LQPIKNIMESSQMCGVDHKQIVCIVEEVKRMSEEEKRKFIKEYEEKEKRASK